MHRPKLKGPCSCGSGKKYRDCCLGKRPREYSILFKVPKETKINGEIIGPDGALIPAYDGQPIQLSDAAVELSYSRPKGRKVLLRAAIDPNQPNVDPNAPLFKYHAVYAVDTNTQQIQGLNVSVACIARLDRKMDEYGIHVTTKIVGAIELHNVIGDPERIAWRLVCELLMEDLKFAHSLKIALVVDSSLGAITQFNEHQIPIVDSWFLPEGFHLIYASSDTATATIGNRLIAICDKQASKILEHVRNLEENQMFCNLYEAAAGESWSHFRNWIWNCDGST